MDSYEIDQYLLDLKGYLVVEDVLSEEEVRVLNELIDNQELPNPEEQIRFGSAAGAHPERPGFLEWGSPFCNLLDHSKIMPILRLRLGDCFRLDRIYGLHMRKGMSRGKLHADYGATAPNSGARGGEYFHLNDSRSLNGFLVVSWNLTLSGPGSGGFCCIPGSHKSNFKLPNKIAEAPEESDCFVIPDAPAGSVTLFSEALTHGTAAWTAKHDRRALLFKYCVSELAWSANRVRPPETVCLSPRQKILFREPADPHRHFPSLFEEGLSPS